jgi:hypothetical protein
VGLRDVTRDTDCGAISLAPNGGSTTSGTLASPVPASGVTHMQAA